MDDKHESETFRRMNVVQIENFLLDRGHRVTVCNNKCTYPDKNRVCCRENGYSLCTNCIWRSLSD